MSSLAYGTKYNGKIQNLLTDYFLMSFSIINSTDTYTTECYFKKVDGSDLSLICIMSNPYLNDKNFSLASLTQEKILNNINNKYNFIIIPFQSDEIIRDDRDLGTTVQFAYPYLLNFTLEDELNISYIMYDQRYVVSVKLNPDSTSLKCTDQCC